MNTQTRVLRAGHLNRLTRSLVQMDSWCLREGTRGDVHILLQHDGSSKRSECPSPDLFGPSASKTELYKCIFLHKVACFVYFIICNVKPTHIPNNFWVHSCFQQNEHCMLHTQYIFKKYHVNLGSAQTLPTIPFRR